MAAQSPGKATAWLCLKFLILAPICLVVWLLLLPTYTWLVGRAAGLVLLYILREPILGMTVQKSGFLNVDTQLMYAVGNIIRSMHNVGKLVTNVAPFVALVLATSGLGVWRRIRVLVLGIAIIFVFHVATILLQFMAPKTTLPTAIGFVAITLPFLLWIVLAYWDRVVEYFAEEQEDHPAPPSNPAE